MWFIDANVFIYSYLARHKATSDEKKRRQFADKILQKIEDGQKAVTTVVHLSEVANAIEDKLPLEQQKKIFDSIVLNELIEVKSVDKRLYELAIEYAFDKKMGINDALAVIVMQKENISQIYSFDSDFDYIQGIERLIE